MATTKADLHNSNLPLLVAKNIIFCVDILFPSHLGHLGHETRLSRMAWFLCDKQLDGEARSDRTSKKIFCEDRN